VIKTLYEDGYSQQSTKGGHQLLPCRESFWGVVECRNRVLWTQGVKEMCFKNVFEGKSHTEQLHANIEFLPLFASIWLIVVKNGYIDIYILVHPCTCTVPIQRHMTIYIDIYAQSSGFFFAFGENTIYAHAYICPCKMFFFAFGENLTQNTYIL